MLAIGSLNIQGVKSNITYLKTLLGNLDVLCIQEHWLFSLEKSYLETIDQNFTCTAKSVDDLIQRLDYKHRRGFGGVCIMYRKELEPYIEVLDIENVRLNVINIATEGKSTLLVNAYMPSNITQGDADYMDVLDQLEEIIQTHKHSRNMLITGDMNASIHRTRTRDMNFQTFINDQSLITCNKNKDTFFHHNGKYTSQIDYFLTINNTAYLIKDSITQDMNPINTSDHTLIQCKLGVVMRVKKQKPTVKRFFPKTK